MNDGRGLVALSLLALLGVAAARSGSKAEVDGHHIPVFALYGDFLDLEYGSPKWWTKIRNARARRRGQRFDPAMDVEVSVTETDWRKLQIARRLPPKLDERDRLIGELQRTFPPEKLAKLKGDSAKQRKLVAELQASLRSEILERSRSGSRGVARSSVSPEKAFDHKLKTALQASKKLPAPDLDPASRLTPQTWEERRLKRVVQGYIDAALDTTTDTSEDDNDDRSLSDKDYDRSDLAEETTAKALRDCLDFLHLCEVMNVDPFSMADVEHVGHDFWLTRNHHGAGFWDGDYGDELGDQLTKIAQSFGEQWWYVDVDGQVYVS